MHRSESKACSLAEHEIRALAGIPDLHKRMGLERTEGALGFSAKAGARFAYVLNACWADKFGAEWS